MRQIILIGVFGYFSAAAFGQQDPQIVSWVSLHPTVHIFSEANFQQLDQEFKDKLEGKVVVYNGKLTIEQLLAYDGMEKSEDANTPSKGEDAELIKGWLGSHPDTKVIKQSEYQSMSQDQRDLYHSLAAMILIGESMTAQDIRNYQY